ncbi:nuclear transport factor 2 family protein [Verrucomicrobiota bacterium]
MTNAEIVRQHLEALNAKDAALVKSMVAEDATLRSQGKTVPHVDVLQTEQDEWKQHPERKYVADEILSEGDKVAVRCTMMDDGSTPTLEMLVLHYLKDGKIARTEVGLISPRP